MPEDGAVNGLREMGWSDLEARLYVVLHASGESLTGYECAKLAGVPRPNVYPALKRLVRRGTLVEVPRGGHMRYQALPFSQVKQGLAARVGAVLDDVARELERPLERPRVALSHGRTALRQAGHTVASEAHRTLDVGASAHTVPIIQDVLGAAEGRGVTVTYYCFDGCPPPGCGACILPVPLRRGPFEVHGWLTLLADGQTAMMATGVDRDPDVLTTDLPPLTETLRTLFSRLRDEATDSSGSLG